MLRGRSESEGSKRAPVNNPLKLGDLWGFCFKETEVS